MQIDIRQLKEDIFKSIPRHLVASIISESHSDIRVTDKLIETYINAAAEKQFTIDKVIYEIRKLNSYESNYKDTVSFILDDLSEVVISDELYDEVCLNINKDTIAYMRKCTENFIAVINIIKENHD